MRLIALLAALILGACSLPATHPRAAAAPTPSPESSGAAGLAAFVPVAEKFVETHRGLKFKTPVKVTFLADSDFVVHLNQANEIDSAAYATEAKVLHALGLLDGLPDLARAERELQGASVIGYYDSTAKELFVRGVDPKPSVRQVLVHELTHALQDQWFGLDHTTSTTDESDIAYRTLIEGDAVRIQDEYVASLSASDQRQIAADDAAFPGPPADVPQVLEEIDAFPYIAGPRFTREVVSAGGQARLDAAFKDPPTTTAEVLHSSVFLSGRGPVAVDQPDAGGAAIDRGVLGELGLDLLLERLVVGGQVGRGQAATITAGWSGDRYVAWDEGGQTCRRDRFRMSDAAADRALVAALGRFVATHAGATVEGTGPVLFTTCA